MMKQIIYAGAILLIIQVGLVVTLNMGGSNLKAVTPDKKFVELTPNTISEIEITDEDSQQLILQKNNSGWTISSAYSAPADTNLVKDLLTILTQAKQGFAVATSSGAANRFKTANNDFERHIIIKKGDQTILDFYLGKSAGMGKSHVRKSGEQEVYTLPLSSFQVEANADKWLDSKSFQLDVSALKGVELADLELVKKDNGWLVIGFEEKDINTSEIDKLIKAIGDLKVQSVLDPVEVKSLFDEGPDFQFTVATDKEDSISYSFKKKDDFNILKISTSDLFFKVYDWQLEGLKAFTKEKAIQDNENLEQTETSKN